MNHPKNFLLLVILIFIGFPIFAQVGIGVGGSWVSPMNRSQEFFAADKGLRLFFTPDVGETNVNWNFGFAWTKFSPKQALFNTETPNGVKGDVVFSDYVSVPVFAGADFKISKKPIGLYAGAYIGTNYIGYTVSSHDAWGSHFDDFSGLNAFFSPRFGATVLDTDWFSISLDAQYFATLNKKAGWLEDYVTFSLSFMYKTTWYM